MVAHLYFRYGTMSSGKSETIISIAKNYEIQGKYTFIIGFSDEQRLLSGTQSWSGKALEDIKKTFDFSLLNNDLIDVSYAYYSKATDKQKFVRVLKIIDLFLE